MNRLLDNPVLLKEFRGRMRGGKAFILLTIYLTLMAGLSSLILLTFAISGEIPGSNLITYAGKALFWAVAGVEMTMTCFVAPALTAGAISSERERQTFDLLRTTLLSARSLVLGKYVSAFSFLLLLLVVAFPLQSLSYLMGGVAIEEVFIAFLLLIITAAAFSAVGLFVSSFTRSTLASTVISYVIANLIVFGIPLFIYIALILFSVLTLGNITNLSPLQETLLNILIFTIGWCFVAINPVATAIATEVILIEEQSAFYALIPMSNGWSFPLLSPWIGYVALYALLSLMLIGLSIRFVRKAEK